MDLRSWLNYLFGTEDYVNLRRELVLFREYMLSYNHSGVRAICSGSVGEGIAYPASDDDVMFCHTLKRVVKSHSEASEFGDLLLVPSEDSPGYCLLDDVSHSFPASCIFPLNNRSFLSSSLFKQFNLGIQNAIFQGVYKNEPISAKQYGSYDWNNTQSKVLSGTKSTMFEGMSIHGPCVLLNYKVGFEHDHAVCFTCSFWPDIAREWVVRNRSHGWPPREMIQNIVQTGCHVVPTGDEDSFFFLNEWRLSFSEAERTLMHSLNHVQFLTYNLLRLTFKKVIEKTIPGVLCSYNIKTTLFHTIENNPACMWQVNEFESCLKACLSMLYDFVDHRRCTSYFIQDYNIIKQKVYRSNHQQLLQLIRSLHSSAIVEIIHLCGESSCMKKSITSGIMELHQDYEFNTSFHFQVAVEAFILVLSKLSREDIESCGCLLFQILNILKNSPIDKLQGLFLTRGIIFCCQILMNRVKNVTEGNKTKHRLHKSIELLLRIGYTADLTTGKLTAATYMYQVGKTTSSLSLIWRLLSEYPSHPLDVSSCNEITSKAYVEFMCNRGYNIDYKARYAWVPQYRFSAVCLNAFPKAFRTWISIENCIILDPLTYTYVLESLCYIRLRNHSSLMKSTRCLVDHINNLEKDYKAKAKLCVGIIKYELGDGGSACRWLGSVYTTKNSLSSSLQLHRSAFTYLACLLNKRFGDDI